MSKLADTSHAAGITARPGWRAYYTLTKPNVVLLLLLTALVGMCLATPDGLPLERVMAGLAGIGLLAASAAVCNHVLDQQIDRQMARTYHRPVASGSITPVQAVIFAGVLGTVGMAVLLVWVNPLTAWLTLASLVGYAGIYTLYLKRATPQNIVIGGLAGAAPPLLGWVAITGEVHAHALLLVLIVYTWTPPHFWALAVHRQKDYARAAIPMLPVTHGIGFTCTMVLSYTVLLTLVCLLPYLVGMTSMVYLLASSVLNLLFVGYAWQLKVSDDPRWAMRTFRFSIVHLMLLFVALLVDHYVPVTL